MIVISTVGIWRFCRKNRSLSRKTVLWKVLSKGGWSTVLTFSVIGLYLLKVQVAPLTNTLATLTAATGESVPDISFRRVADDVPQHLHEFAGKVVLLNLWGTWCPPCREEMPTLERLQATYKDQGLVVITLSDEPREKLQAYHEKFPVDLLRGYTSAFEWLEIETFRPLTIVIDREGILRHHVFGSLSYEEFESSIRPYL